MEYTLEQKALALLDGELWWRFPSGRTTLEQTWTLVLEDEGRGVGRGSVTHPDAVYHIGPKAPPILSELEAELLAALEEMLRLYEEGATMVGLVGPIIESTRAAIKKARGEA
jgi:hypothetical protein